MARTDEFPGIFAALREHLAPHAPDLVVTADTGAHYSLDAPPSPEYAAGLFFGSVAVRKNYVSYHLMPVYAFPDLLDDVSPALRQRMQGKSCFNFTRLDDDVSRELAALTERGLARYRAEGLA